MLWELEKAYSNKVWTFVHWPPLDDLAASPVMRWAVRLLDGPAMMMVGASN